VNIITINGILLINLIGLHISSRIYLIFRLVNYASILILQISIALQCVYYVSSIMTLTFGLLKPFYLQNFHV